MGALEPPPPVVDPDLQNLTFDQLAQLVDEVRPDVFYEHGHAFDLAVARYEQIQDDLDRETRNMWEAWSGRIAESFDDLVRQVDALTAEVVQAMVSPGYGTAMRQAGDALARAQQRMQDLRAQNRQNDVEAARQVVIDLETAYRDIGAAMAPMPEALTGAPNPAAGRIAPGPVEAAGALDVTNESHPGAGAHGGGPAVELAAAAFAALPGLHRPGSVLPGWLAAAPGGLGHGADCAAPAVLGRGAPEAAPRAAEQPLRERPRDEAVVVLGRTARTTKSNTAAAQKKKRHADAEHGATATQAGEQHGEPRTEAKVVTSAGPERHEAPARQVPPSTEAAALSHAQTAHTPATPSPATPAAAPAPAAHALATAARAPAAAAPQVPEPPARPAPALHGPV
ncbi:hypothetical protein AB0N03_41650, partial [Amycolatopsis sp. NPDC051061]